MAPSPMSITRIRTTPLALPLRQPYHWAGRVDHAAAVTLIEVETGAGIRLVDGLPAMSFCMSMGIPSDIGKASPYRRQAALMIALMDAYRPEPLPKGVRSEITYIPKQR